MEITVKVNLTKLDTTKAPEESMIEDALVDAIDGIDTIEIGDENDTMYSVNGTTVVR